MPTTVTGLDAYSNEWATAPDDGEPVKAADTRAVAQIALSNTLWIKNRFVNGETGGTYTADITFTGEIDVPNEFSAGIATIEELSAAIANIQDLTAVNAAVFLSDVSVGDDLVVVDDVTVGGDQTVTGDYKYASAKTWHRVAKAVPRYDPVRFEEPPLGTNTILWLKQILNESSLADYEFTDIPDGATITGASIRIEPATAHSSVPGTMPQIQLVYQDVTTGDDFQVIATEVDDSPNETAYDTPHDITISGQSFVHDASKHKVVVRFRGEFGTSELPNMLIFPPRLTGTVGSLKP